MWKFSVFLQWRPNSVAFFTEGIDKKNTYCCVFYHEKFRLTCRHTHFYCIYCKHGLVDWTQSLVPLLLYSEPHAQHAILTVPHAMHVKNINEGRMEQSWPRLTWESYVGILCGNLTWDSYVGILRGTHTEIMWSVEYDDCQQEKATQLCQIRQQSCLTPW